MNKKPIKINELKLVLVGEGGVGKTSLVHSLKSENPFSPYETTTYGLETHKWKIQVDEETVNLNIWDFGGQAIFHTAYQLFLTQRSLYLLVINPRYGQNANRIEYWLKLIQTFGATSPVILVVTHSDQSDFDFDWFGLQRKYKNIKAIAKHVSNKTREGVNELHSLIIRELKQLETLSITMPQSWFNVKTLLEALDSNLISYASFSQYCLAEGISDEKEQTVLLRILHDLGTLIHFEDNSQLNNFVILNPSWVLLGIISVYDDHLIRSHKGLLNVKQLNDVLDKKQFPEETHDLLMELLIKVEFCVGLDDNQNYLITSNVPITPPEFDWDYDDSVGFHYDYHFLPETLFIRFLSKIYSYIRKGAYWKTGAVIEYKQSNGLVLVDLMDNKIHIYVSGETKNRRELLALIRKQFEGIHSSIGKVTVKETISLPDYPDKSIDYGLVMSLYKLGEKDFIPTGFSKRVGIRQLLEEVETDQYIQEIKVVKVPIRVFLCHASGDKPQVRQLYDRLVADNVDAWLDEKKLIPGQEWQLEIPKAVRASNVVIICLSNNSISKAGYVQKEIRYALDVADEQPEGAIYLIPVRLEKCEVPTRLRRWQWVDLYQEDGYYRLLQALITRANDLQLLHPGNNESKTVAYR